MYIYIYMYIYICIYIYVYICINICIYIYVCVCVCVCAYMYTLMHTGIYTYIHACMCVYNVGTHIQQCIICMEGNSLGQSFHSELKDSRPYTVNVASNLICGQGRKASLIRLCWQSTACDIPKWGCNRRPRSRCQSGAWRLTRRWLDSYPLPDARAKKWTSFQMLPGISSDHRHGKKPGSLRGMRTTMGCGLAGLDGRQVCLPIDHDRSDSESKLSTHSAIGSMSDEILQPAIEVGAKPFDEVFQTSRSWFLWHFSFPWYRATGRLVASESWLRENCAGKFRKAVRLGQSMSKSCFLNTVLICTVDFPSPNRISLMFPSSPGCRSATSLHNACSSDSSSHECLPTRWDTLGSPLGSPSCAVWVDAGCRLWPPKSCSIKQGLGQGRAGCAENLMDELLTLLVCSCFSISMLDGSHLGSSQLFTVQTCFLCFLGVKEAEASRSSENTNRYHLPNDSGVEVLSKMKWEWQVA